MLYLHVSLTIVELVLKDFAVHNVLVLVDEGSHACVRRRTLVLVLDDVESVRAIGVHTGRDDEFVELALAHLINVRVDVKLNLQAVHLGAGRDARDYIMKV